MATEIERKFLVHDDSWRKDADGGILYRQGYLSSGGPCAIRVRVAGTRAYLSIKSANSGTSRAEFDYTIPLSDAESILNDLCIRPPIEKTRYLVRCGEHVWEVDVFAAENAGLVVAEIELKHEDERFERPVWLGKEVSEDERYYNAYLAEHPYQHWKAPST